MLRRSLIAASRSEKLRRTAMEFAPARAVAMRFVAGETIAGALDVARDLNARGMAVSLDHLGESVEDEQVAVRAAEVYGRTLDEIADADLDAAISVKLTQLGVDVSLDLCHELLDEVCARAAGHGRHVTVDMEGSDHTQTTVDLVLELRGRGRDNLGCAVQAYLHRTPEDVRRLLEAGASLRLCKGAYLERPEIAYQRAEEVDDAYLRLAEQMLTAEPRSRIATHDHRILHKVRNLARRVGREDVEYQMLYGVREEIQRELVAAGHDLRVYVPFGDEWYPYFMRRLAERPANLAFFLRALIGLRSR